LLIESAFFKLSDYFQSVESPSELYEEQVAFIFAVAIYQELQNRGFPYLLPYIQFEKPYPSQIVTKRSIYTSGSLRISFQQRSSIGGARAGYARRTGLR